MRWRYAEWMRRHDGVETVLHDAEELRVGHDHGQHILFDRHRNAAA